MVVRSEKEWKDDPRPGELLYHIKWSHGLWVSNKVDSSHLDAIHRELHGPPPDGWIDNGTWAPDHSHVFAPEQLEIPTDSGDSWQW